MRIFSEEQVLDERFRQIVIREILGSENVARKYESKRRYDLYKDKTRQYVLDNLKKEGLFESTIEQMRNRASNINILKKVVNKRAMSYVGGVERWTDSEAKSEQVALLEDKLDYNSKMKKADRFKDLYKNTALYFVPESDSIEDGKLYLSMKVLSPWQMDVIEDSADRESAKCVILTDYSDSVSTDSLSASGDGEDQTIADNPDDASSMMFTWWTDSYHFVTDKSGAILSKYSPDNLENPIRILPFTFIHEDQDGQFWADGGSDLVDGAITINTIITDMFYVARLQGYGQPVLSGKNLPDRLHLGPNNALMLEYDAAADEPKPEFSIVSSNPPLDQWLNTIEQYLALLLTTNNLSPSTVRMKLDAASFPSGIAMIIDMAEVNIDIQDSREQYLAAERRNWKIITLWVNLLNANGFGNSSMLEIGTIDESDPVMTKFLDIKQVISEKEKLENLEKRKSLGLNELVDLILMDNPDMSRLDAEDKLNKISKEKLKMFGGQTDEMTSLDENLDYRDDLQK